MPDSLITFSASAQPLQGPLPPRHDDVKQRLKAAREVSIVVSCLWSLLSSAAFTVTDGKRRKKKKTYSK